MTWRDVELAIMHWWLFLSFGLQTHSAGNTDTGII
jgi:hypothetical protein